MHWLDGLGMAWTWLAWLAILGAVVWLGTWALRSGLGAPREPPRESAEEILKRRYATGEIDETEYQRRLAELRR
jgi:uncharacterized membrane protein